MTSTERTAPPYHRIVRCDTERARCTAVQMHRKDHTHRRPSLMTTAITGQAKDTARTAALALRRHPNKAIDQPMIDESAHVATKTNTTVALSAQTMLVVVTTAPARLPVRIVQAARASQIALVSRSATDHRHLIAPLVAHAMSPTIPPLRPHVHAASIHHREIWAIGIVACAIHQDRMLPIVVLGSTWCPYTSVTRSSSKAGHSVTIASGPVMVSIRAIWTMAVAAETNASAGQAISITASSVPRRQNGADEANPIHTQRCLPRRLNALNQRQRKLINPTNQRSS